MVESISIGFMVFIWGAIIYTYFKDKSQHCPVCKSETTGVGFEGWKRKCENCGWNNYTKGGK